jgi:SulP family sulfate permease
MVLGAKRMVRPLGPIDSTRVKSSRASDRLVHWFPVLGWARQYQKIHLAGDLVAGTVVAIMLVPQAMAYALLAGLPAQVGLYASLFPLVLYALLGSSRTLAVGPVAIVSLMVANAIAEVGATDPVDVLIIGMTLALLSGLILIALGLARLGFFVNFVSHSVVSGFTSAAALIIGISQLKSLLGFAIPRGNVTDTVGFAASNIANTNLTTLALGVGAILVLVSWPKLVTWFSRNDSGSSAAFTALAKAGPLIAVLGGTLLVVLFRLDSSASVAVVGTIPNGLPSLTQPTLEWALWRELLTPALLIVFIGFMESVAVAKTLASKRRQKIDANQELVALGAANIGASVTGGYPVTGGFSRSVVNFTAGANTPFASIVSASWILLTLVLLTPLFHFLPRAVLAAIILVAVATLIDVRAVSKTWRYNKADAIALAVTFVAVLLLGVEQGILSGIAISIVLFLYRTSRPHIAIVGRVGQSEHFRNIHRHTVHTDPRVLAIRVDESLYFANARYLEDYLLSAVADEAEIEHVVLIMNAVNFVDTSALESLENLIDELRDAGVTVHMAEIKGPVMDQFERSKLLDHLTPGQIFLSTHQAMQALSEHDDR